MDQFSGVTIAEDVSADFSLDAARPEAFRRPTDSDDTASIQADRCGMTQDDLYNHTTPVLTSNDFEADGTGTRETTAALNKLLSALPNNGGTALIRRGRHLVNGTLWISSHTRIVCECGATLVASAKWLSPPRDPRVGLLKTVFANRNYLADEVLDNDFSVTNCSFDLRAMDAGGSAVFARMATNFHFTGLTSFGGGNLTKVMAGTHYTISNNIAFDSTNACYGQFEHPADFKVTNNYCRSAAPNAILVTGTNFDLSGAGKALDGIIEGNLIEGGVNGGGHIWINGIGGPGSGANDIRVIGNHVDSGNVAQACVRISGHSDGNVVRNNTCVGGQAAAILDDMDSGGAPTNTVIAQNNIRVTSVGRGGGQGIIVSIGEGTQILDNTVSGIGAYPAGIWIGGVNQTLKGNSVESGVLGKYVTRDASNFSFSE